MVLSLVWGTQVGFTSLAGTAASSTFGHLQQLVQPLVGYYPVFLLW